MALKIYGPGNWIPDPGFNGRAYPAPKRSEDNDTEIIYSNQIQYTNYNQANLVAIFTEWFKSFFPNDYFRYVRIKTQSPFSDFKSFMKNIYKKDFPGLVIDPRPMEIVEDFLFAQTVLNRYNVIDPQHENISAKLLYSKLISCSDLYELYYRRNRLRAEFDVLIMERTQNRQTDTFNNMIMNIRHNSKFMLTRTVPMLLPLKYIVNIANWHGFDWKSEAFLEFLNSRSKYPIRKEIRTNGRIDFYFIKELHVQVEVPGFPDKDSSENSDAIEWGTRIVDRFVFIADLPTEYIFLMKKEYVGKFDNHINIDPDAISFISPIFADLDWPTEYGDYKLSNRLDVEFQEGDPNKFDIIEYIRNMDKDICKVITDWIRFGGNIGDLVLVHVWPNGSYIETGSILHQDGQLELVSAQTNKLYSVNIYLNVKTINLIRDGKEKKYIGTIEQATSDNVTQ